MPLFAIVPDEDVAADEEHAAKDLTRIGQAFEIFDRHARSPDKLRFAMARDYLPQVEFWTATNAEDHLQNTKYSIPECNSMKEPPSVQLSVGSKVPLLF